MMMMMMINVKIYTNGWSMFRSIF